MSVNSCGVNYSVKRTLRQELPGQLLEGMARITRAGAPGTEEVRGRSVHSTEEKPQGHRERMHPGGKGSWFGWRQRGGGDDRTQSPGISRTACLCCIVARTPWSLKLKKKNKNQIMKFYMQRDVKLCSHFRRKKKSGSSSNNST